MKSPEQMMSTLNDINRLKNFANGGYLKAIGRPNGENEENTNIDKFGRGFNQDHRFSGIGEHKLVYSSKRGYFGSSDTYTILEISNRDLFWECFDKYLNQHQDEILNAVADLMRIELQKDIDVLKAERDRINSVIGELINKRTND